MCVCVCVRGGGGGGGGAGGVWTGKGDPRGAYMSQEANYCLKSTYKTLLVEEADQ